MGTANRTAASPKITRQMILSWGGPQVLQESEAMVKRGAVLRTDYTPPTLSGAVARGGGEVRTSARILPNGMIENNCPCWANREQGLICNHIIAVALMQLRRSTDPRREQKYQEEQRRAKRLAAIEETAYIRRADGKTLGGGVPATLELTLEANWLDAFEDGRVRVHSEIGMRGQRMAVNQVPTATPLRLSKQDDAILYVLEDIAEGPATTPLDVVRSDFINILELMRGRALTVTGSAPISVNATPMATRLQLDLDRENGELLLFAQTALPFMQEGEFPAYLLHGSKGWAYGAGHLWPLEQVLPGPYQAIYGEPVVVPRTDVWRFMQSELPGLGKLLPLASEISPDLFSIEPAVPQFHLAIKGSPASLAATLFARYDNHDLVAAKGDSRGDFCIPDPDDLLRYTVRNGGAETEAVRSLAEVGFRGGVGDELTPVTGTRNVLNVLGAHLPALRRRGWRVSMEGRVSGLMDELEMATPVVHINEHDDDGWFEVGFEFEDPAGASLSATEIQRALLKGDAYVTHGERTILIDSSAVASMRDIFNDCASAEGSQAGRFRMSSIYAPFVKSSLDALDGIDVEEPPAWRQRAAQQNRRSHMAPVALGAPLDGILRPYQKEGVSWLRFMEESGFCGLLADEMGLGKTLQTLSWLQLTRSRREYADQPVLIVCPTSLVENWAKEAEKFVPHLKVLMVSGADRHASWEKLPDADLVVTSYALLRRDLDHYLEYTFAAAVLDEAQHIKNRATRNSVAAKQIKADCRLVLTGTPVENSVADLWSIMDFLMPGYLGSYPLFRANYEQPIAKGDRDGEIAQKKLRRKLHPFLLRRLKRDVAKDLPPKIEKVSYCVLSPDQQAVYNELLQQSRQRIKGLVAEKGFNRCRMEILATLMKLRQICCHLELLNQGALKGAKAPSAKLEQFFELVNEAVDGGHRILVFSQFVSMLKILRRELEARSLEYCYLDGSSKNRMASVQRFNMERSIPLFLISLKAGGTGLNLTGADMVIHYDPWWNPAVEDQATDRAHRIGQKRTVYGVKLITEHTIEEKVLAMQKRKKAIINATVESDEAMMKSLSWNDVQDLLSLS